MQICIIKILLDCVASVNKQTIMHPLFVPTIPLPFNSTKKVCQPRLNSVFARTSPGTAEDLLIIGAGDLGLLIGHEWLKHYPRAYITAETRTSKNHSRLLSANLHPYMPTSTTLDEQRPRASNVIFCVPPPKIPNYLTILSKSLSTRMHPEFAKNFLFISSTAVHPKDVKIISEKTEYTDTERAILLSECEKQVLKSGYGSVIRYSGLFSLRRGPHAFWASRKVERVSERKTANMLHRADAAKAAVSALLYGQPGNTYLAAAKESVSAKDICQAMVQHPEYEDCKVPTIFSDSFEKRECDCSWTRDVLGWKPTWESLVDFMREDGRRVSNGLETDRLIE